MKKFSKLDKFIFGLAAAIVIFLIVALILIFAPPKRESFNKELYDQFIAVEKYGNSQRGLLIVYDKDTKVMYYLIDDAYQMALSPIYNADGTIKIYKGVNENE